MLLKRYISQLPPAPATLCFHLGHVTCACAQGAAACWHSLPDPAPPCVLMSMMSGSFHSICIRPMQPLAVSSDGSIATAPGGVLCMRNTSSKVQAAAALDTLHATLRLLCAPFVSRDMLVQASWLKRATGAWEMGGWMRGLAEGGYGMNMARNVAMMQELQVADVQLTASPLVVMR